MAITISNFTYLNYGAIKVFFSNMGYCHMGHTLLIDYIWGPFMAKEELTINYWALRNNYSYLVCKGANLGKNNLYIPSADKDGSWDDSL